MAVLSDIHSLMPVGFLKNVFIYERLLPGRLFAVVVI